MSLPVVAITNESTVLTDDQIAAIIPALQHQVSLDFKGFWNIEAALQLLPKDQSLPAGWWQIVIVDDPDMAGALGYHELSSQGTPLGKVFAKLDIENGVSWSCTISHELLEMLADPWINFIGQGSDGKLYALEVCDPCEADGLGYQIDGVLVSDFITPSWYEPTEAPIYDFKEHLKAAFEISPGGYISILGPDGNWTQVQAEHPTAEALPVPTGSRRQRRTMPRSSWRNSLKAS